MKKGVLDKPLEKKSNKEVSLSVFAFLFSEIIQQAQIRSARVNDLESRLIELVWVCTWGCVVTFFFVAGKARGGEAGGAAVHETSPG